MHPINQQLLDDGWKIWPTPWEKTATFLAKSFDNHAECKCNEGKRKQVEIYHYHPRRYDNTDVPDSWKVQIVGQLPDNEWLRISIGGLSDYDVIQRTVDQLLQVWDHAVVIAPNIEEPD